ncbi:MAG: PEP-CTERM sorting domain-containing protein [Gammaproteobacteria bacterium]
MKRCLMAAAVGAALFCQPALAKIHVLNFTGTVTDTVNTSNDAHDSVPGWVPGTSIEKGAHIVGSFSFEGNEAPWLASPPATDFHFNAPFTYAFSVPASGIETGQGGGYLSAEQSEGDRVFRMGGATSPYVILSYELRGHPADPSAPFTLAPEGFAQQSFNVYWYDSGFIRYYFDAHIDSVVDVTPVPEPATYGMLLAGLALVGAAARTRRR